MTLPQQEGGKTVDKQVMNVKDLAKYLGFGISKIYQMARNREIPTSRIRGQYRFLKTVIDEWLRKTASLGEKKRK